MPDRGTDALVARLDDHEARLKRMYDDAAAVERGRPALSAALAQAAAEFAWHHHTGWFASEPLERLVQRLGRDLPGVRPARARGPRTLHVVTQMYQTGGHTQLLTRWTDELADREHEIVATRQLTSPVPEKVRRRIGDRVSLTRLDTAPGTLLRRAARLRELASTADLVVSHCHPHDVVPALAFADRRGLPPVVYVDNADHVFWLGVAAYDRVMHLRRSGQALAQRRRGLSPERSLVANRPLAVPHRSRSREAAKRDWDIPADDVLVITAADGGKFHGADGPDLPSIVEEVVLAEPRLQWRVAGPDPDAEPWRSLARRTGGRARALGVLPDVGGLHEAADVYLDSFPFSGLTSLLESGAVGNPVVTYRGHPDECAVWGSDSPGIDDLMVRPGSPEELRRALSALVHDPAEREERGLATARAVASSHTGPGWAAAAERLYDLPSDVPDDLRPPVSERGPLDLLTVAVQGTSPHQRSAEESVDGMLGAVPLRDGLPLWREARRRGAGAPRALLPEWALAAVAARRR